MTNDKGGWGKEKQDGVDDGLTKGRMMHILGRGVAYRKKKTNLTDTCGTRFESYIV